MTACPGCRVLLPGPGDPWHPRSTASEACHALYGEALGYEHLHLARVGRWHQLLVDTYAAQHAGDPTTRIATAFALIGLYLTLEHGWSGIEVRDAHQLLAGRYRDWPGFEAPRAPASITVQDLVLTGSPDEYVEVLHRWAQAVWASWEDQHDRVAALINERLPGNGRRRMRSGT
jgi:hypothetical protein